ncbi:MAG: EF-P lysine aminoacylase EpmA [Myxococcota bacterium]
MKRIPEIIEMRAKLFAETRRFFDERGYIEVDTPLLYPYRDMTVHLSDFVTTYRDEKGAITLSLPTSPEVYMKRLIAEGAKKIYQICHFFRNGEVAESHNPEFAALEFYEVGADYQKTMGVTTDYLKSLFYVFGMRDTLAYGDNRVNVTGDWERLTLAEAVERYSGVDIRGKTDRETLRAELEKKGYEVNSTDSYDDMFFRLFLSKVERNLGARSPLWVYDYPKEMCAYAREKKGEPGVAERCELYIAGVELANGFTELNDSAEQRRRFIEWGREKEKKTGEKFPIDERFIEAVGKMPDCAGIAVGLERILMLIANTDKIADVLPFPFCE